MKKKLLITVACLSVVIAAFFICSEEKEQHSINRLRAQHETFLENSPYKETLSLSREERKAQGIPPNKYHEREWELTMNPELGYPEPYKLTQLQKNLKNPKSDLAYRVPGDAADNQWTERGPNNIGGRTRVVFFDPNDPANLRVFAGSVSGGLWVTEDITANGGWTQVSDVPGNLNISCYAIDPNDSNTWYIGTGEQNTASGNVIGNGLYRTTDGGISWSSVDVEVAGGGNLFAPGLWFLFSGIYYINDIVARDNGAGSTELYLAVGAHYHYPAGSEIDILGTQNAGLYRSTDNGATWSRNESATFYFDVGGVDFYYIPNDLEIAADNTLWMGTIETPGLFIDGASGQIYSSSDGLNWTEEYQVTNGDRVEIETSATDPDKIYVLAETDTDPVMYVTTDAFAGAPTAITLPDDADLNIPANDFTRGQSHYNLVVEADPTNDDIVYIGGIDLFRSTDSGTTWSQISKWSNNNNLAALSVPYVHADQHALSFRPGNSNQAVLGHDGGISFASDLATADSDPTAIYNVDYDYNTVQFYHMAVAPTAASGGGDLFFGGTQDNGTLYFEFPNPAAPDNALLDLTGGDGAYGFYDQVATDYLIASGTYNNSIFLYDFSIGAWRDVAFNANFEGDFINPQALDSNMDLLYSNGATFTPGPGWTYQLFRYENLTNLLPAVEAPRTVLTNALLDAPATALEVSPYTPAQTNLVVGLQNSRLLSITNADNAAINWIDITGPMFFGSISDVQFGQTENDIFVTFHNYGVISIWYSNDGGATWQDKEGNLPDMPVKCILQNPLNPEEVIVGTELGVWRTANFSAVDPDWTQSYNGMSDVKVTSMQLRDDNMVFAATYGRGIFSGEFTAVPLSVDTNDLVAREINIYPNPSNGEINIRSTADLGETRLDVFDLTGRNVYSARRSVSKGSVNTLQLHTLPSGVYLLNFNNGKQKFAKRVIIK